MKHGSVIIAVVLLAAAAARAEDPRMAVHLPDEVRTSFLEEMRGHMDSLDDVIAALADGDVKAAGSAARRQLGIGSGKGHGRFMPREFREMGMAMHRAAFDFADAADQVGSPPSAEEWLAVVQGVRAISVQCRACHAAFRVE